MVRGRASRARRALSAMSTERSRVSASGHFIPTVSGEVRRALLHTARLSHDPAIDTRSFDSARPEVDRLRDYGDL